MPSLTCLLRPPQRKTKQTKSRPPAGNRRLRDHIRQRKKTSSLSCSTHNSARFRLRRHSARIYRESSEKKSKPDRVRKDQKGNAKWSPQNKSPIKSLELTFEQRKLLLKITYDPVNTPAIDRKKRDEWHQQHHAFIKALKEFKPAPELREISGDLSESIKVHCSFQH